MPAVGAYARYAIFRNLRRKKTRVLRLGCLDVKHREGCTASSGEFYLPVPRRIAVGDQYVADRVNLLLSCTPRIVWQQYEQ